MFWKVLRYASQHDLAVWKFLEDHIYNNYSTQSALHFTFWHSTLVLYYMAQDICYEHQMTLDREPAETKVNIIRQ